MRHGPRGAARRDVRGAGELHAAGDPGPAGEGAATVNELAEPFDLTLPAISKHIKVLERGRARGARAAGAVPARPRSTPAALERVSSWAEQYRPCGRAASTGWTTTSPSCDRDRAGEDDDGHRRRDDRGDRAHLRRARSSTVWQMWTDPEHFEAWYGPDRRHDPGRGARRPRRRRTTDLHGGADPGGPMRMWFTGEHLEVVENERLVYTESMSDEDGNVTAPRRGHARRTTTEVRVELEDARRSDEDGHDPRRRARGLTWRSRMDDGVRQARRPPLDARRVVNRADVRWRRRRRRGLRRGGASRCGCVRAGWRPTPGSGARRARTVGRGRRSTSSSTRASGSLTSRSPVRRSQLAKNAPPTRRHGRPIIVERSTPGRASSGSARSQKRASPGVGGGHRSPSSAAVGTRSPASGSGPGSRPVGGRRRGGRGSWPSRRRGRRPWVRRGRGGRAAAGCRRRGVRG